MTLEWDWADMTGGQYPSFENGIVGDPGLQNVDNSHLVHQPLWNHPSLNFSILRSGWMVWFRWVLLVLAMGSGVVEMDCVVYRTRNKDDFWGLLLSCFNWLYLRASCEMWCEMWDGVVCFIHGWVGGCTVLYSKRSSSYCVDFALKWDWLDTLTSWRLCMSDGSFVGYARITCNGILGMNGLREIKDSRTNIYVSVQNITSSKCWKPPQLPGVSQDLLA